MDQSIPLESVSIVSLTSLTEFILYLSPSTFSSLIWRKAVLQFLSLHIDDILHTATKMATLPVSSGDKTSADSLEKQWGSKIKYFIKQALENINLEEYLFTFKRIVSF